MYLKPETYQAKKVNNDITKEEPIYAIPISDHNDATVSYQRFMRNKLLLSRCGSAQIYCLLMYANWGTNGMTLRITYLSCTAYLNSYVGIITR